MVVLVAWIKIVEGHMERKGESLDVFWDFKIISTMSEYRHW
jgi:hypothetical protein